MIILKENKTNWKYLLIIIILAIAVGGLLIFLKNINIGEFCGSSEGNCNSDSDCFATGCSGQICSNKIVLTTCEFKSCYNNEAYGLSCICFNGRCGWMRK